MAQAKRVNLTTGIGVLSFPRVFPDTVGKKDDGKPSYDIQILIPKTDKDSVRAILRAIKEVGEDKWGAKYKSVRTPLRDGDAEKDDLTEDGSTKGEKYPERLGHYFMNARSNRPVSVVDRTRTPILDSGELYGGCKGKIAVSFYAYSTQGNHGIGCGLEGVQKIADGESFGGGGRPSVESMFDILDDEDIEDIDLDDEDEVEEAPPAKRTTKAKPKAKPAPVEVDEDEDDLYDDLDED